MGLRLNWIRHKRCYTCFKRLPVHLQSKFSDKVGVHSIGYAATFSQLMFLVEDAADRANSLLGQALAQPARYNQSCPRKLKAGHVFSVQTKLLMKGSVKGSQGMFVLLAIATTTRFQNAGSFYVNLFRSTGTSSRVSAYVSIVWVLIICHATVNASQSVNLVLSPSSHCFA